MERFCSSNVPLADALQLLSKNDPCVRDLHLDCSWSLEDDAMLKIVEAINIHSKRYPKDSVVRSISTEIPRSIALVVLFCSAICRLPHVEAVTIRRRSGIASKYLGHYVLYHILEPFERMVHRLQRLEVYDPIQYLSSSTDSSTEVEKINSFILAAVNLEIFALTRIYAPGSNKLSSLIQALIGQKRLRILNLQLSSFTSEPKVTPEDLQVLCRSTSLEQLTLINTGMIDSHLKILSEELRWNLVLKKIDIQQNWQTSENGFLHLLELMQKQFVIVEFNLEEGMALPGFEQENQDRLYEESCASFFFNKRTVAAKIESFARMNRAGRQRIQNDSNYSHDDWIDLISLVGYDIDAIFYMILQKPEVCNRDHRLIATIGDRSRKRRRMA
jgi:hypothetical protein